MLATSVEDYSGLIKSTSPRLMERLYLPLLKRSNKQHPASPKRTLMKISLRVRLLMTAGRNLMLMKRIKTE